MIAEISQRVKRIIENRSTPKDLDRILAWLRFKSRDTPLVKEIGDFSHHLDIKNAGIAARGLANIDTLLSYHIPRIKSHGTGATVPSTLDELRAVAKATIYLETNEQSIQRTGLKKDRVYKILLKALDKIESFDGKYLIPKIGITQKQFEIINTYTSLLRMNNPFNSDELIKQFYQCLLNNDLISRSDESKIIEFENKLAVFSIHRMHMFSMHVASGDKSTLLASVDDDENLVVRAVNQKSWKDGHVDIAVSVFETSCSAPSYVTGWGHSGEASGSFEMPLELTDDWMLAVLI